MSSLFTKLPISLSVLLAALALAMAAASPAHALGDPVGDMEPVTDPVPGNTFGTPIGPPQGGRGDITDVSIEFVPGGIRVCVTRLSEVVTTSSAILWIFGAPGAPQVVAFWENHEGAVSTGASRGGMTIPAVFEVDPAGARGCVTILFEHLGDSETVYAHSFSRQTPLGQQPPPEGDPRLRDISDYQQIGQPPAPDDTSGSDPGASGDDDAASPPDASGGDDPGSTEPSAPSEDAGGTSQGDDSTANDASDGAGGSGPADTDASDSASDPPADADDTDIDESANSGSDNDPPDNGTDDVDEPAADEPRSGAGEDDDPDAGASDDSQDQPAAPGAGISDDSALDPDGPGNGEDQLFDDEGDDGLSWIVAFVFLLLVAGFFIAGGGLYLYARSRPAETVPTLGDLNRDGDVNLADVRSFRAAVAPSSEPRPEHEPAKPVDPLGAQMSVVLPDVMMVRADGERWSGAGIPMHFARDLRAEAANATDRNAATDRLYEALEMEYEGLAGGGDLPTSNDPQLERDRGQLADGDNREQRLDDIARALQEIEEWYD